MSPELLSPVAGTASATGFDRGRSGRLFADVKASGRGALVGFLHVGYPDVPTSLQAVRALCGVDGDERRPGVDLVEVGMPYSDPMMDGVTIQRAGTLALARGVRTRDTFAAVEAVAETGTQAVVMTYWSLIEKYGPEAFARDLAAAGGSGAITPDLTPDEAGAWIAASDAYDLDRIFLLSPSSTDERIVSTPGRLPWLGLRDSRDGRDRCPLAVVLGRPGSGRADPPE